LDVVCAGSGNVSGGDDGTSCLGSVDGCQDPVEASYILYPDPGCGSGDGGDGNGNGGNGDGGNGGGGNGGGNDGGGNGNCGEDGGCDYYCSPCCSDY
jgi:hypothetical protein